VRETWEETGLFVALTRLVGVFGGEMCSSTYGNGDQVAWVSTVFRGEIVSGTPRPDNEETLEVRYFARSDLAGVQCKPHARLFVEAGWSGQTAAQFQPATWRPPA